MSAPRRGGNRWVTAPSREGTAHGAPYPHHDIDTSHRFCGSCGSYHGASYRGCNGLRDDQHRRCTEFLFGLTCDRPLGHLGSHHSRRPEALFVEWHWAPDGWRSPDGAET